MVSPLAGSAAFVENWGKIRSLLDTVGPPSLAALREESIHLFSSAGFPNHKTEEFKYTSLRAIEETDFAPAYGATVLKQELRKTPLGKVEGTSLVFVNGQYAPEISDVQSLPGGMLVLPLQNALEAHQDLVMRHLAEIATLRGRLGGTNDERFVWLANAHLGEGAFVYLPEGVVAPDPIHLVFASKADHGPFAAYPRVLIVAEEGAQAKVVETYQGLEGVYFNCAVTELCLGENSMVEHTRVQMENAGAFHIGTLSASQASSSTLTSNNVQLGGSIGRVDVNVLVDGEHSETWLNGVYAANGSQLLDNHTRIDHAKPHCNSFEVYKGILDGKSRGVFNGKIFVYEDAQKTDAKQTNQAILLSREAAVDTKPQLEIFADDVKCTHGATVGQLSDEMMFYMRSRGIPEAEARALLVYAFAAAGLEKIGVESVKSAMESELTAKLAGRC